MSQTEIYTIEIEEWPRTAVVKLRGDIDISVAYSVQCTLTRLAETHARLLIDLTGLNFMDSRCLGALLALRESLHSRHGTLGIVSTTPHIDRCFTATSLDRLFHFYPSVAAFLETIEASLPAPAAGNPTKKRPLRRLGTEELL